MQVRREGKEGANAWQGRATDVAGNLVKDGQERERLPPLKMARGNQHLGTGLDLGTDVHGGLRVFLGSLGLGFRFLGF